MAFRKKAEFILDGNPDILIVPECECPEKLMFKNSSAKYKNLFWFGQNPNKGLGVFSYSDFEIKLFDIHNPDFKYVIPLSIKNDRIDLTVFAIWTQKPEKHDCYTEQVWNAMHCYSKLLENENVIIAGDFNSSSIWDKPNRIYNHSNLVDYLKKKNITSAYHAFNAEEHGKESRATLFMHRRLERPYHIDFCFASDHLIDRIKSVEVGEYETWTTYSDHKPLIVTFEV